MVMECLKVSGYTTGVCISWKIIGKIGVFGKSDTAGTPLNRKNLRRQFAIPVKSMDENGYVRLVVTRGPGHLGLTPDGCGPANIIIIADDIQLYLRNYMKMV